MMKRYLLASALGLMAASVAVPAAAHAAEPGPVLLAMNEYASSTAGTDVAARVAKKKAAYHAHAGKHHVKCDLKDCGDCPDCPDCPDCADCDEAKVARKVAEEKAGICDPTKHALGKVKHG